MLSAGACAFRREKDKRGRRDQKGDEPQLDNRPNDALGSRKAIRPLKREALVQKIGADKDAAHKAGKADDCVEVAARDAQDHAEGTSKEHEGADHDAEPKHKASDWRRAAAGRELLLCEGKQEASEHKADKLWADILNRLRSVKPEAASGIADKAGDAEAHVGGIAEEHEHRCDDSDDGAASDDRSLLLLQVHNEVSLLSSITSRPFADQTSCLIRKQIISRYSFP